MNASTPLPQVDVHTIARGRALERLLEHPDLRFLVLPVGRDGAPSRARISSQAALMNVASTAERAWSLVEWRRRAPQFRRASFTVVELIGFPEARAS